MLYRQVVKTMIDFDGDTAFTQRMLDVLSRRTKAAMHNIANQNVPGFKRYQVRFEDLLQEAAKKGDDERTVEPVVERDMSGPPGANNVVLMEELSLLGKTSMLHDLMTRRAGAYFSTLNKAIFGR
jgi:flagellar basal body rod protein FlgB